MTTSRFTVLALCATALVACVDNSEPTAPRPSEGVAMSLSAGQPASHLVLFRGNGIPADFAAQVAELGGSVSYTHEPTAFAVVDGLSAARAAGLGALKSVAEVHADEAVSLALPQRAEAILTSGVRVASQASPATAILFPWQWNMQAIGAPTAWAAGRLGSDEVSVAIIDTGIDYDAFDLDGLVDLSRSRSFVESDDSIRAELLPSRHPITDFSGHGTTVATIVSSKAFAFAGVSSRTRLIGVKVLDRTGSGTVSDILAGVLHAADQRADVINMSLGFPFTKFSNPGFVGVLSRVLDYTQRQGSLIVVAAGNDEADLDHNIFPDATGVMRHFPSLYFAFCDSPHVICVSAVGPQIATGSPDLPAVYTNYGRSAISVAGPGGNAGGPVSVWPWGPDNVSWVWSLCAKDRLVKVGLGTFDFIRPCSSGFFATGSVGTSNAAPHVAGLAALLVAEDGRGKPSQIRHRIVQGADDLGQPGTDPFYGKGRINIPRTLGLD